MVENNDFTNRCCGLLPFLVFGFGLWFVVCGCVIVFWFVVLGCVIVFWLLCLGLLLHVTCRLFDVEFDTDSDFFFYIKALRTIIQ